jgi:hypothetical protein
MVYCIYYYYHELVKERVGANPPRRFDDAKRRAEDCTRNIAKLSTATRRIFLVFCSQMTIFSLLTLVDQRCLSTIYIKFESS